MLQKIRVSYNKYAFAETVITIHEPSETAIIGIPNIVDLDLNHTMNLNPILNIGEGVLSYTNRKTLKL